jgi:ligand-binding SRPBCC domain-containing protein
MKTYSFSSEIWLPRTLEDVFPFFVDARNLQRITPPWLRFEVLTPGEIRMRPGTIIDYRLRVRGVPILWQSEITVWEPPWRFADEQRKGPYLSWVHDHRFVEKDGGTLAVDDVRYSVPGGPIVNALFVARDVRKIFEFRARALRELFAPR